MNDRRLALIIAGRGVDYSSFFIFLFSNINTMTTTNTSKNVSSVGQPDPKKKSQGQSSGAKSSENNSARPVVTSKSGFKINPEFEALLMPLSGEEFELLEQSILKYGLQYPIITGEDGTVYDGHTRLKICRKHGKDISHVVVNLGDDEAVKRWIIEQQLGRRNLTTYLKVLYSLRYKEHFSAKAKANQQAGALLKSAKGTNTREEIARMAGVSPDTVAKVEYIEEHGDEAAKEQFRKGDRTVSINNIYQTLKRKQKEVESAQVAPTADTESGPEAPVPPVGKDSASDAVNDPSNDASDDGESCIEESPEVLFVFVLEIMKSYSADKKERFYNMIYDSMTEDGYRAGDKIARKGDPRESRNRDV